MSLAREGNSLGVRAVQAQPVPGVLRLRTRSSIRVAALLALGVSALALSACGHTVEQKAATGAIAGAVVAGPVGAAVGGAAGAAVGHIDKPH